MSRSAWMSTGVFLVLLVLVVATRDDRVSVGVRKLELPRFSADEIERIEIGGRFQAVLRKDGEDWSVARSADSDRRDPVEKSLLERALSAVEEMEAREFVSGRTDKHAELEIDEEQGVSLGVSSADGTSIEVVLGRSAKNGGTLLRLRGEDEVYVAPASLKAGLYKNASEFRRRGIVALEIDEIRELEVAMAGEAPYRIVTEIEEAGELKAGSWNLEVDEALPEGFELDTAALGQVLRAFAQLRAAEFVDENPGEQITGLGEGATELRATASGGASVAVRFGAADDADRIHLKVLGAEQIYLVPSFSVERIARPLSSLRDLSLLTLDTGSVRRVEFRHEGVLAALSRGDGPSDWSLEVPVERPAGYVFDPDSVAGKLRLIARTRGTRFLGSEAEVDADFSDPVEIAFAFEDGSERKVTFGQLLDVGQAGEGAQEVAVKPGNGFVYSVGAIQRTRYLSPLDLFQRVDPPPGPPGGMGGMQGLENLPPEVRRQLEEQLRQRGMGAPAP